MKLVPLFDKVVLKQLVAEETTKSGIVLPGAAKEKPQQAEVNVFTFSSFWAHFISSFAYALRTGVLMPIITSSEMVGISFE